MATQKAFDHPRAPHNQPFCVGAFEHKKSNQRTAPQFKPNYSRRNAWFMKFKSNKTYGAAA